MIEMKTPVLQVMSVVKKTKRQFFQDLVVGDMIQLRMPVKYPGRGRNGIRATSVICTNMKDPTKIHYELMSGVCSALDCFNFQEVKD